MSESAMQRPVAAIMTADPVSVTGGTTLDEARRLMDEHDIRHLPVLAGPEAGAGELVGVVSDRDLLRATGWLPARVHAARGGTTGDHVPRHVREIVHQPVHATGPDESAGSAALRLLQLRIGCLPVVDDGALVGIVTEMDLLAAYASLGDGATGTARESVGQHMTQAPTSIHWFTTLGAAVELCQANGIRHLPVLEGDDLAGLVSDRDLRRALGAGRHADMPVDEIVTREVVKIDPETSLFRAAKLMTEHRFSCLPVVDGEALVGMVTSTDVLARCLDALPG